MSDAIQESEDLQSLPPLTDGEEVRIASIRILSKKTKPPSYYTEGTLLDDMRAAGKFIENDSELKKVLKEVSGLGTAATRDSIIEGLKTDNYLKLVGKQLHMTEKGIEFMAWLERVAPSLTDVAMTARWEAELAVVAQRGNGPEFEKRVCDYIKELVIVLKNAPPLNGLSTSTSNPSTEKPSMTENDRPPTDKMLVYAKRIAAKLGLNVPDDVMVSGKACSAFIDEHKDAASRPTEKQLNFAKSLATEAGIEVPAEALVDGVALSKWIDARMAKK